MRVVQVVQHVLAQLMREFLAAVSAGPPWLFVCEPMLVGAMASVRH